MEEKITHYLRKCNYCKYYRFTEICPICKNNKHSRIADVSEEQIAEGIRNYITTRNLQVLENEFLKTKAQVEPDPEPNEILYVHNINLGKSILVDKESLLVPSPVPFSHFEKYSKEMADTMFMRENIYSGVDSIRQNILNRFIYGVNLSKFPNSRLEKQKLKGQAKQKYIEHKLKECIQIPNRPGKVDIVISPKLLGYFEILRRHGGMSEEKYQNVLRIINRVHSIQSSHEAYKASVDSFVSRIMSKFEIVEEEVKK